MREKKAGLKECWNFVLEEIRKQKCMECINHKNYKAIIKRRK